MGLLVIIFVATLAVSGLTYVFVQRTFQTRDSAKMRDRLAGKPAAAKKKSTEGAGAKSLFLGGDAKTLLSKALQKLNIDRGLNTLVEQAGVTWAPGQVALACVSFALVAFNLCWYMAPPQIKELAFIIAPAAGSLPILFLKRKRSKRIYAFEGQLPDALQFIARAMRAGHAFSVSLEMLHKEFAQPLAGEFRRAFEEQNLGLPMESALGKLSERMPLLDVQFFVAAVVLQKRTGGNLAEILENLSVLIRERFKLRGEIRSISAHGRLSSLVLTCIPAGVGVMMYFVNRDHMMFFVEDEMGNLMAGAAIGFVLLGYFIMSRIVKIEV